MSGAGLTVTVNAWKLRPKSFIARIPQPIARLHSGPLRDGTAGVPLMVAVPSLLSLKLSPPGRKIPLTSTGAGDPVVLIVKEPGSPAVKTAVFGELKAGALPRVKIKFWVTVPVLLVAVRVMG